MKFKNRFSIFPARVLIRFGLVAVGTSSLVHANNTWDGGGSAVGGLWNWSDVINWGGDTARLCLAR